MNKRSKLLVSMLVVGVLGGIAGLGIFGAFSATTTNAGNEVRSGNVLLSDNDAGSALYFLPNAKPGDTVTRCIKVTYTGSLNANVRLYTPDNSLGPLAQYVDLIITQGTQSSSTFPNCSGFTPSAGGGVLYTGTLANFSTTRTNYATGIDTNPVSPAIGWNTNDTLVYQYQVTLNASAPATVEAQTTGTHAFTWEAVNN
jgi:hypothetical protein